MTKEEQVFILKQDIASLASQLEMWKERAQAHDKTIDACHAEMKCLESKIARAIQWGKGRAIYAPVLNGMLEILEAKP